MLRVGRAWWRASRPRRWANAGRLLRPISIRACLPLPDRSRLRAVPRSNGVKPTPRRCLSLITPSTSCSVSSGSSSSRIGWRRCARCVACGAQASARGYGLARDRSGPRLRRPSSGARTAHRARASSIMRAPFSLCDAEDLSSLIAEGGFEALDLRAEIGAVRFRVGGALSGQLRRRFPAAAPVAAAPPECGCRILDSACRGWRWQDRRVVLSCLYWLFRHLLGLIVLRCRSEAAKRSRSLSCGTSWRCCGGRSDVRTAGR